MQIYIRLPGGKVITLDVTQDTTINDIKKQIEEKQHLPLKNQVLARKGGELSNEDTVENLGIKAEETIYLSMKEEDTSYMMGKKVKVTVTNEVGSSSIMEFEETDSIAIVKSKVYEKVGGNESTKRIIHDGRQLDNEKTVKGSNIKSGTNLVVAAVTRGGSL